MSDDFDAVSIALSTLRAHGLDPEPCEDDRERWQIADFRLSDDDVMQLAQRVEIATEA